MHAKSNRITYRFNEQEQQLLEINNATHSKKEQSEETELKKAFTIMPLKEATLLNSIEQGKNEWPNIEELEALIRGEAGHLNSHLPDAVQQLELPLAITNNHIADSAVDENLAYIKHENIKTSSHEVIDFPKQLNTDLTENESTEPERHTTQPKRNTMQHSIEYQELAPPNSASIPFIEEQYYKSLEAGKHEPQASELSVAWKKVASAIFSSIITGVLIGYVLLLAVYGVKVWPVNLISLDLNKQINVNNGDAVPTVAVPVNNDPAVLPSNTENNNAVNEPLQNNSASGESVTENANNSAIVIQPMQTFTYTVLQAGVFTKNDTKQALVDRLNAAGYPATSISTYDGKMVVFAGIASDSKSTFQMSHMKDIELYRKAFSVHAPKLSDEENVDKQLQQWIYNTHALMNSSMKMGEAQFEQTSFSAIYKDSYQVLVEQYNAFRQETEQLITSLGDDALASHLQWHLDQFKLLYEQWNTYQDKPSREALFKIQNYLLTILSYQIKWFEN